MCFAFWVKMEYHPIIMCQRYTFFSLAMEKENIRNLCMCRMTCCFQHSRVVQFCKSAKSCNMIVPYFF
uniref:Uncharacterized protein n=1 Tax=Arundo donax TaxID=35708 RepID=A0A0A9E3E4_ARUDO